MRPVIMGIPPISIEEMRRRSRLPQALFAAAIHTGRSTLCRNTKRPHIATWVKAWVVWICYLKPDPKLGWAKAALCLPPDAKLAPEVAQALAKSLQRARYEPQTLSIVSLPTTNKKPRKRKAGESPQSKAAEVKPEPEGQADDPTEPMNPS